MDKILLIKNDTTQKQALFLNGLCTMTYDPMTDCEQVSRNMEKVAAALFKIEQCELRKVTTTAADTCSWEWIYNKLGEQEKQNYRLTYRIIDPYGLCYTTEEVIPAQTLQCAIEYLHDRFANIEESLLWIHDLESQVEFQQLPSLRQVEPNTYQLLPVVGSRIVLLAGNSRIVLSMENEGVAADIFRENAHETSVDCMSALFTQCIPIHQ